MSLSIPSNARESIRVGRDVIASPEVSIIIPAYKIASYIAETLDSALAQTYASYEIIVINDGSPDTEAFESALAPYLEQIVYLVQPNLGAGVARNFGIRQARGIWLAFLDGDDIWYPDFLKSQMAYLTENGLDMVYADALLFGGSAFDGRTFMKDAPSDGEATFDRLLDLRCNVITSGTVARRSVVLAAGLFETEKVRAHDFVLWLRIAKTGAHIGYQRQVLLKYRVRIDSLSGNSIERIQREIDVYHRVERLIDLNPAQRAIVRVHLTRLDADMAVERGKSSLLRRDFEEATKAFIAANQFRKSNQLRLVILLSRVAPTLLLWLFRFRRDEEIAFIPHG